MPHSETDYRRYLSPAMLAKIDGLELRARLIVEGFFAGMHRSPHRGLSVEFADHRVYTQGDDIRHIDWKLYGKTDKYYVKEYEQETNLELLLLVDCSESMRYRSDGAPMSKHDYCVAIAAALAYLSLRQQDSVGLALYDQHVRSFIRPSSSAHHWRTLVKELAGKTGPVKTDTGRVLSEMAERLSHRTLILLMGDLIDDVDRTMRGLRQLVFRRHEVVVFCVWDPAELTFPFRGPTRFEGLEDTGTLLTEPEALHTRYMAEVHRFQTALQRGCSQLRVDFHQFDTASAVDAALSTYLAVRSARLRQRASRTMSRR